MFMKGKNLQNLTIVRHYTNACPSGKDDVPCPGSVKRTHAFPRYVPGLLPRQGTCTAIDLFTHARQWVSV